ncbi:MAG: hypothetical protein HYS87_02220 [Candidatus Colwellbacteria bacterium]|nr:hypothetical protein [Candidatus Colwellbacteria bacterium]
MVEISTCPRHKEVALTSSGDCPECAKFIKNLGLAEETGTAINKEEEKKKLHIEWLKERKKLMGEA